MLKPVSKLQTYSEKYTRSSLCGRLASLSVWTMGRLGEVALLFALFVLLGTLHGTKAQYDEYGEYDYDESDYHYEDDYGEEAGYQEEDEDASGEEVGDEVIELESKYIENHYQLKFEFQYWLKPWPIVLAW